MPTSHRVKKKDLRKIESHHTIGFDDITLIDWHLRNLFDDGFKTIIDMPKKKHRKHTAKANSLRYWKRLDNNRLELKSGLVSIYNPKN